MQFLDFFILFGLVFQFGVGLDLDTEDDTVAAFIPEQMVPLGICNNRDSHGYPTCLTHKFANGKLYFRLGSYGYSRTRASHACNVMGGYLAVPENQDENDAINVLLNRAVGGAQFALMTEQEDTESGIGTLQYNSYCMSHTIDEVFNTK